MANKQRVIAVGIAFHHAEQRLNDAVGSALAQSVPGYQVHAVVLDSSPKRSAPVLLRHLGSHPRLHIVAGKARSAYAARNRLIGLAERRWPELAWHVRLDADDTFTTHAALALTLEGVRPMHRVVLGGNRQIARDGSQIGRNIPGQSLLRRRTVLKRLADMSAGVFAAELPSCNLILKAGMPWRYPAKRSAEDHWLLASVLLQMRPERVHIRPVELVDYKVGGELTKANKGKGYYLAKRKELLEAARGWRRSG